MGGAADGEGVEGDLGGGVLRLPQRRAEARALEDLAVKVDSGFEPRSMVRSLPYASV